MMMTQRTVGDFFQLLALDQLDAAHARGRPQMIHDREGFIEAFRGDDVLVVDAFVLVTRPRAVAMKPDVMLPRDLSESLIIRHDRFLLLQIASRVLLFLQRLEERFEIAFAETLRAFALDDFEKERRPIFHRLGEDLQQITFVIAIDQNAESLQRLEVFIDVADAIGQLS